MNEFTSEINDILSSILKKLSTKKDEKKLFLFVEKLNDNLKHGAPKERIFALATHLNIFENLLTTRRADLIFKLWNESLLQEYFAGNKINIGTKKRPIDCEIKKEKLIMLICNASYIKTTGDENFFHLFVGKVNKISALDLACKMEPCLQGKIKEWRNGSVSQEETSTDDDFWDKLMPESLPLNNDDNILLKETPVYIPSKIILVNLPKKGLRFSENLNPLSRSRFGSL